MAIFPSTSSIASGALFAHEGWNVYIDGICSFLHNTAVADGGENGRGRVLLSKRTETDAMEY